MSHTSHLGLPEFKELVKDRVDLAEIVARNTKLEKSSNGFKACCPLPGHQEKTASFNVNTRDNFFYCYGCNRGGDVFTYLELVEGLSFMDALKELADSLQLDFPKSKKGTSFNGGSEYKEKKDRSLKLMDRTAQFYHRALLGGTDVASKTALSYLEERGVSSKEIESYSIGWTPSGDNCLHHKLAAQKELFETALELDLVRKGTKGFYDFFIKRLMIPIQDLRGRVVAFSGRSLEDTTDKNPKYKNSAESFLFKKKEVLYGFYQTQKLIRASDFVCIVEGFFDQWAFQRKGIPSVAVMGTSLTEDHLRFIGRHTKQVVMVLDNDSAGLRSTLRSLPMLLRHNFDVKVFTGAKGKDPDEWLREKSLKPEEVKKLLLESQEGLMWWGDLVLSEAKEKSLNKLQRIERLSEVWAYAKTEAHRTLFLLEFAPSLALSVEDLRRSLSGGRVAGGGASSERAPSDFYEQYEERRAVAPALRERELGVIDRFALKSLGYWLAHWDELIPKERDEWERRERLFRGTLAEDFVTKLRAECCREPKAVVGADFVKNYLNAQGKSLPLELESVLLQTIVRGDTGQDLPKEAAMLQKGFAEYAQQLNREQMRKEIAIMQKKLREVSGDAEKTVQLLQVIQRLRLSLEND